MIAAIVLSVLVGVSPHAAANEAMAHDRMEVMLADGDSEWIVQTFRRHPDSVLPFVDHYLEGGLKVIETTEDGAKATTMFRDGLKFAKLADQAFHETIFSQYAASFGSWSPMERKHFRQGQAEFHKGASQDDADQAMEHYLRSQKLAEPLGDQWGTAMAYGGIAQAHANREEWEQARKAAVKAAELTSRLRLRTSHIRARYLIGLSYLKTEPMQSGVVHLRIAYEQLQPQDRAELRRDVVEAYRNALIEVGRAEDAEAITHVGPAPAAEAAESGE